MKKTSRTPSRSRKKVQTKTQTITNTQLLMAGFAALLANGLAWAAVPVKAPAAVVQKMSCVPTVTGTDRACTIRKGVPGFRSFTFTCPNGKSFRVNTSCRTADSIRTLGLQTCSSKKYCAVPAPAQPVAAPLGATTRSFSKVSAPAAVQNFSDIGFVGRPEENITFSRRDNGTAEVVVHFINRGPAELPASEQGAGRTHLTLSFLDEKQTPFQFAPETFFTPEAFIKILPAVAGGQATQMSFVLPAAVVKEIDAKGIQFLKAELLVGNRGGADNAPSDPDISNNMLIVDMSSFGQP